MPKFRERVTLPDSPAGPDDAVKKAYVDEALAPWTDDTPFDVGGSVDLADLFNGLPRQLDAYVYPRLTADNSTAAAKTLYVRGHTSNGQIHLQSSESGVLRVVEVASLSISDVNHFGTRDIDFRMSGAIDIVNGRYHPMSCRLVAASLDLRSQAMLSLTDTSVIVPNIGIRGDSILILRTSSSVSSSIYLDSSSTLVIESNYTGPEPVVSGTGVVVDRRSGNVKGTYALNYGDTELFITDLAAMPVLYGRTMAGTWTPNPAGSALRVTRGGGWQFVDMVINGTLADSTGTLQMDMTPCVPYIRPMRNMGGVIAGIFILGQVTNTMETPIRWGYNQNQQLLYFYTVDDRIVSGNGILRGSLNMLYPHS